MKGEVTTVEGNTGDHSGDALKTLDKAAIEDPVLVNTVEERLANLNSITKEPPKRSAESEDDQDKSTPDDKDDQQADDQDKSTDTTPKSTDGDTDADKDVVLPPAFLRAAIHRGWKEEDANEFFESNPEAALKTFQNCLIDVNNASNEWALLGKAKQNRDTVLNAPEVKPTEPEFKGVDINKLKEEYDLDDKTIAMLEAQNQQFETVMNRQQPEPAPQQPQQQVPVGPDPNVELQVENFFKSADLNSYEEFYGKLNLGQDWSDLSSGQRNNRWKVLEQAELMIVGAESMNHRIDPLDALDRAHMFVSEPVREQVIRNDIKNTATKRKNSMTLRPSDGSRNINKVTSDADGELKPRTREELKEKVQEKLDHLFNQ
jgi:hypothetical protein